MSQFKALLITLYILGGTVTYGHAYQFNDRRAVNMYTGEVGVADSPTMGLLAVVSSAAWPLYWSQYFWRHP